ncbi:MULTISPECIES: hypothetical protein [Sphingomonas]|uniref:hypothetical protein n=1 Tax=Sphingomonas TaxID=13687 RepID=UPI000DEF1166|nr:MULTISPECIES: hypothetical protein [Sphingomonas]
MTPSEIFFGLSSVILGLALTEIASSIAKLLRAGRQVRWAPEPVLQTILIIMILVYVWADQWWYHDRASFTVGQALFQVAKLMALYVAAASVLGEREGKMSVDLKEHYYALRGVTYGSLCISLSLFEAYAVVFAVAPRPFGFERFLAAAWLPLAYLIAAVVRWRAYHLLLLVGVIVSFARAITVIAIK